MGKSKKEPFLTQQQRSRKSSKTKASTSVAAKRTANRKVRAANKKACDEQEGEELADGKQYRKASDSWNIRDWAFHSPKDKKAYRK